jgi:hypothetical protein
MTDSFDNAPDADDHPPLASSPASPSPRPEAFPPRRAKSRTGRVLRWWLGISMVLVAACIACVAIGVSEFDFTPLHIVIGDDASNGVTISGVSEGARALLGAGAVVLALLLLLLLPLLLLLVIGIVAIALVAGVGLPLLALAIAFLAVSSPLWMVGLVVWLIVRDRRPSRLPAASARMAA